MKPQKVTVVSVPSGLPAKNCDCNLQPQEDSLHVIPDYVSFPQRKRYLSHMYNIHIRMHACTHAHTYIRTYARTCARMHMHARTHIRTHACMHARTYTYAHINTYALTCACMHAYIRTHTHTHVCTHARTYTLIVLHTNAIGAWSARSKEAGEDSRSRFGSTSVPWLAIRCTRGPTVLGGALAPWVCPRPPKGHGEETCSPHQGGGPQVWYDHSLEHSIHRV